MKPKQIILIVLDLWMLIGCVRNITVFGTALPGFGQVHFFFAVRPVRLCELVGFEVLMFSSNGI